MWHLCQEAALPSMSCLSDRRPEAGPGGQVGAALAAIGLAPGPGLSADQLPVARRKAVGLGPGASEAELRAVQAAVRAKLLALLKLPAGAPAGTVRAALNKKSEHGDLPIHRALRNKATGPELVRAMLDAGGEAMLAVPGECKALPLHWAARNSPFPAVVALLLARGPAGSARAKTVHGDTPLYYAERFNTGPGAAEIKALLRAAMR